MHLLPSLQFGCGTDLFRPILSVNSDPFAVSMTTGCCLNRDGWCHYHHRTSRCSVFLTKRLPSSGAANPKMVESPDFVLTHGRCCLNQAFPLDAALDSPRVLKVNDTYCSLVADRFRWNSFKPSGSMSSARFCRLFIFTLVHDDRISPATSRKELTSSQTAWSGHDSETAQFAPHTSLAENHINANVENTNEYTETILFELTNSNAINAQALIQTISQTICSRSTQTRWVCTYCFTSSLFPNVQLPSRCWSKMLGRTSNVYCEPNGNKNTNTLRNWDDATKFIIRNQLLNYCVMALRRMRERFWIDNNTTLQAFIAWVYRCSNHSRRHRRHLFCSHSHFHINVLVSRRGAGRRWQTPPAKWIRKR